MTLLRKLRDYFRSSLPRKFMLTVVIVNTLLVAALGWELLDRDRALRDHRRIHQATDMANLLAASAPQAMARRDTAELERLARTAAAAESVERVIFRLDSGRVLASAAGEGSGAPILRRPPPGLARSREAFSVAVPVRDGARTIGTVQVAVDRSPSFAVQRQPWFFALVYGVAVIIVGGLIAFVTARGVTVRLTKVAALADRFRHGEHEARLSDDRPDEVGTVARGVNEMLDAIAESERALKDVFRIAQIGSWRFAPPDPELQLSDTLRELLGLDAGAPMPLVTDFATRLSARQRRKLTELLESGEPGSTYGFTFGFRDSRDVARTFWAEARVELRGDTGRRALAGVCQDVTEREAAAHQLRQAQKMEAVGQLTGGLAHDFNNLLAIIVGNLDLLEEGLEPDSSARELVGEAMEASLRGSELTRQLLAFSRRQPLAPQKVDLNHLISAMSSMLKRTLGESVDVRLFLGDGLWPTRADPSQVESAVLNLVINARDAMPDGGAVTIETSNRTIETGNGYDGEEEDIQPGDYAVIAVSDTGTGMPPEIVARAFEPFFTTKAVGRGSGLGLSMIYGFAKQSEGTVRIYSEPGQGTTVRLYLPRHSVGKAAAEASRESAPIPLAANEIILLVEDNDGVRRVVERQLVELGYSVLTAASGQEALEMLEAAEHVDLLFTDVVMPGGINGFELGRRARLMKPDLRILYTSGFTRPAPNGTAGMEPPPELLTKPYRKVELAAKLREALDRPSGKPPPDDD